MNVHYLDLLCKFENSENYIMLEKKKKIVAKDYSNEILYQLDFPGFNIEDIEIFIVKNPLKVVIVASRSDKFFGDLTEKVEFAIDDKIISPDEFINVSYELGILSLNFKKC